MDSDEPGVHGPWGGRPKIRLAVAYFRRFPAEVRHDISRYFPGRHIREWHQGSMSSSELLDLLEFLPEESATKTAERMGDWTSDQYRIARLVNEIALMRYERAGGQKPQLDVSPGQEFFKREKDSWRVERHKAGLRQLMGEAVSDV